MMSAWARDAAIQLFKTHGKMWKVKIARPVLRPVFAALAVSLTLASPCLAEKGEDRDDRVEIVRDQSAKDSIDRDVLRILANLDREISPLGVRIYNYDEIKTASKYGMLLVSAVKLPKGPVDTKAVLTVEHGFRAVIDPTTFRIKEIFTLEGGNIELPR